MKSKYVTFVCLALSVSYFLYFTIPYITAYGATYEDAGWLNYARLFAASGLKNVHLMSPEGYAGNFPGICFGIMVFLFGQTLFVLKMTLVLCGILAILFNFLFISKLFNRPTALLTIALLVINPNFIVCTRTSCVGEIIFQLMLTPCWMWIFLLGIHSKRPWLLFAGTFLVGFAIWVKLTALGPSLGALLALGTICLFSKQWRNKSILLLRTHYRLLLSALLLGITPLIYSNIFEIKLTTLHCVLQATKTTNNWNNFNLFQNLSVRWLHLTTFWTNILVIFPEYTKHFFLSFKTLFSIGVSGVIIYMLSNKKLPDYSKTKIAFILLWTLFLFCLTCFVPYGSNDAIHMNILFPLPELILAIAILLGYRQSKKSGLFAVLTFCLLTPYIAFSCATSLTHNHLLSKGISPVDRVVYSPVLTHKIGPFLAENGFTINIETPGPFLSALIPFYAQNSYYIPHLFPRTCTHYNPSAETRIPFNWPFCTIVCIRDHNMELKNTPEQHVAKIAMFSDRFHVYDVYFRWRPQKAIAQTLQTYSPSKLTNVKKVVPIRKAIEEYYNENERF